MAYRHVTTGISSNLTYRHRKARTLVLNPYLEVVGRTRIMEISLEPAPSASNKLYRYHYTVSCEFPTFPDTIDNQLLPLLFTNKIIPPPCTQGLCRGMHRLRCIGDTCCKNTKSFLNDKQNYGKIFKCGRNLQPHLRTGHNLRPVLNALLYLVLRRLDAKEIAHAIHGESREGNHIGMELPLLNQQLFR